MSDKGIIFSAPMVRAVLDGRKTQTRRVLKPQPEPGWHSPKVSPGIGATWTRPNGGVVDRRAPYTVGDRLWVREAWRPQMDEELWCCVEYRADGARLKPHIEDDNEGGIFAEACDRVDPDWRKWGVEPEAPRWRSPIHMPRWASRITIVVTEVRVQRLQEISEADARAEGCDPIHMAPGGAYGNPSDGWLDYCEGFRNLWNSLHGPEAWDANPWVAAISFDVHRENIDHLAPPVSAKGAGRSGDRRREVK